MALVAFSLRLTAVTDLSGRLQVAHVQLWSIQSVDRTVDFVTSVYGTVDSRLSRKSTIGLLFYILN